MAEPNLAELFNQNGFPAVPVSRVDERPVLFNPGPRCQAARVVLAGSKLMGLINSPSVVPLERVWRRFPLSGAFTATPSRPFSFELGAVEVPAQMTFVLLDYRFGIYVPSGVAAGNSVELDDRELSTSVGYEVLFNEHRPDNVRYELTPSAPTTSATETYAPGQSGGTIPGGPLQPPSPATFQTLRAGNSRASVSSGLSTLPQRHRRDAQLAMPFTYVVNSNQRVNLTVHVFSGIPIPISFWEGEVSGLFLPKLQLDAFLKEVGPCGPE